MRILSFSSFIALAALNLVVASGNAKAEQKLELEAYQQSTQVNLLQTRHIGIDPKANEIMVIDNSQQLPKRFIEVIEVSRGITADGQIDPLKIDAKLMLRHKPFSGKTLGKIGVLLNGLMTDYKVDKFIKQTATDAVSEQYTSRWAQFHFSGKVLKNRGAKRVTFYGYNVGQVSLQQSIGNKYALLIDGKLSFVDYAQYAEFAVDQTFAKRSALIKLAKFDVGAGYVLTRTVGDIAALVTNGTEQKIVTRDMKLENFDKATDIVGKPIYPMAAIDQLGQPKKGFGTFITGLQDDRDVEIDVNLTEMIGQSRFIKRFGQLSGSFRGASAS